MCKSYYIFFFHSGDSNALWKQDFKIQFSNLGTMAGGLHMSPAHIVCYGNMDCQVFKGKIQNSTIFETLYVYRISSYSFRTFMYCDLWPYVL